MKSKQPKIHSEKTAAVRAFSLLLITICVYLLLWQALCVKIQLPVYYYGRLIELLGIGLFIALSLCTPMHFEEMGIVTDGKTLLRSLSLGGGIALLLVGVLAAIGSLRGTDPLFSWHIAGDISRATYFLVAPLQEILAKSVMYYSFELCLGREHPFRVVLLSAFVFGIFHVVYGIQMMLLSMLLTLLTGWMFHRVRCVWGCALAHFAFGFFPLCFGIG
ncbi:MAG: CPBP family intramembrane metalloprotease [Ruminococcaceae bacterium]|nr:CPBP family intramembrane metalloprotease [Oscillospiraceae bacterium]